MRRGADQQPMLGKYRLLAELGHGGMADVYLAVAEGPAGFSKLIVIKRLRNVDDPQYTTMFLDEARLAARLSHPNIVQTYEVGEDAGSHFMVMEHLEGPTLGRLRRRAAGQGGVPLAIELEILCNVLEGLHYAHELRGYDGKPLEVVHRDLSPQNVIVTQLGDCKVLDFGIAKARDSLSSTQVGFYKGRLKNMPAEQMRGEKVDRRADIFAAGVLLWEGVSGRPLWGDLSNHAIGYRLAEGDLPRLEEIGADVPADLRELCARALHVQPEGRFATALDFKAALVAFMQRHQLGISRSQLAAFVEPLFAEEREQTRKILEARLATGSELPAVASSPAPLPRVEPSSGAGRAKVVVPTPSTAASPVAGEVVASTARVARQKWLPRAAAGAVLVGLAAVGVVRLTATHEAPANVSAPQPMPPQLPQPGTQQLPPPTAPLPGHAAEIPSPKPVENTPASPLQHPPLPDGLMDRRPHPPNPRKHERTLAGERPRPAHADGEAKPEAPTRRTTRSLDENPYAGAPSTAPAPKAKRSLDRDNPWQGQGQAGDQQ
jgi:serine/threonine protein kinase